MDALLTSSDVDALLSLPEGTSEKMALQGAVPYVIWPDGSIRFEQARLEEVIEYSRVEPARARRFPSPPPAPPLPPSERATKLWCPDGAANALERGGRYETHVLPQLLLITSECVRHAVRAGELPLRRGIPTHQTSGKPPFDVILASDIIAWWQAKKPWETGGTLDPFGLSPAARTALDQAAEARRVRSHQYFHAGHEGTRGQVEPSHATPNGVAKTRKGTQG